MIGREMNHAAKISPLARRAGPAGAARRGFTLIEVLVALALLVALTGLAWPMLDRQIRAAELPESASRVQSLLYMTRSSAMLEHRRHRIRFEPGVQQPFIEYEPDPIRAPGEFFTVPAAWAREQVLLGEVQVHHIQPGRPIYLRSLGIDEDPETVQQQIEEERQAQLEAGRTDDETVDAFTDLASGDDVELDENRPIIFFESDGTADWATIVLARIDPNEALEEEEVQSWVVLDGRTGLTTIREQVTQEQLNDPESTSRGRSWRFPTPPHSMN
jgi:prepilin-type N-terminal cleavage/methylation domain-containing protein